MFPAIQFSITECIQQALAGVTFVEQLFPNCSNNQCRNYRNHNSNSTIVCGQSVRRVKTTFLDLLETLGSQLRARWGRDITFYWWRCWCYPEQRLLRDGGWYSWYQPSIPGLMTRHSCLSKECDGVCWKNSLLLRSCHHQCYWMGHQMPEYGNSERDT